MSKPPIHDRNAILSKLNPSILRQLAPYLSSAELKVGRIVVDTGQYISKVFFPHGGILSCVVETIEGSGIETAMIGRDGVFGALQALDHRKSINKVVVRVPCSASVMDCNLLRALALKLPDFRDLLVRYEQFTLAQAQQSAACNALHNIEQRTCKWLLRMHNLAGADLPLTHDYLAQMIGVRRTSITTIAGKLQSEGLIKYSRGKLRIADLEGVAHYACGCADVVKHSYDELLGEHALSTNSDYARPLP